MSRLKFKVGDRVVVSWCGGDATRVVDQVEPALEHPYFLDDGNWYAENDLSAYTPLAREWREIEDDIAHAAHQLRKKFAERDAAGMSLSIRIKGRVDGDLSIEYEVDDSAYGASGGVKGYSVDAIVDELFRRKGWEARNKPLLLTATGDATEAAE